MPVFIPKPKRYNGHRVVFGDVFLESPELPDWVRILIEDGVVTQDRDKGCLRWEGDDHLDEHDSKHGEGSVMVGDWLFQAEDDRLNRVGNATLAHEYDLFSA